MSPAGDVTLEPVSYTHLDVYKRQIWYNPETDRYTTIPNHPGDMPEGTLRAILKQAGVKPEEFLGA